ncbi:PH domain-containing protein [Yaniella flava]|uniref:PH domain-containing protein n=1 Tax=Yaniella flava TaxID=287930 RepID=A0ABN2URJ1_9MICC
MKAFPAHIAFQPVRSELATYRQIHNLISLVIYVGILGGSAALISALSDPGWWHILFYIPAIWILIHCVVRIFIIPHQVRIHGWSEQSDDILIRSGAIFRAHTAVPYGRLQFVTVRQGPLQRKFDLADVSITTAGSKAAIHGLPTREATRLRDDLSSRGYARLAGL